LKTGKIVSCVGNEIISALVPDSKISLDFGRVNDLYGKTVYVDDSAIGKVCDVIGRVSSPYVVIRKRKNLPSSLIGRSIQIKV